MNLTIDNGSGALDYSSYLDAARLPKITRKLNQPGEMQAWLTAGPDGFTVPKLGAKVALRKSDGSAVFAGYLTQAPQAEALGWGETGLLSRWLLTAEGEEYALDRQVLPARAPMVGCSGDVILKALAAELSPSLNVDGVQAMEMLAPFSVDPELKWSEHAAELGVLCRAAYRIHDGKLIFAPASSQTLQIGEQTPGFDEAALVLEQPHDVVNDITLLGEAGPQRYVKDYFQGDGLTYSFYLALQPFSPSAGSLLLEDYTGQLAADVWSVADPAQAIQSGSGSLVVNGGTGIDGQTSLVMAQKLELGGALVLQHGEVSFQSPGQGVIGGLYAGSISTAACLAGFSISPSGSSTVIRALVNGSLVGPTITTVSGHRYVLVTRFYCAEPFRTQQLFHSALHAGGSGAGGATIAADLNLVLELRDVDPNYAASMLAAPTVLFDGAISNAPAFASYAVVNSANLHCKVGYTNIQKSVSAEVRVTPSGSTVSSSKIVGEKIEGATCEIFTGTPEVVFYSYGLPGLGDAVRVSYRDSSPAQERAQNQASIAAFAKPGDSGLRSAVLQLKSPAARTSDECQSAAVTLLEDAATTPLSGQYQCWSDWLPQVTPANSALAGDPADVWPGDAIAIALPSRSLQVQATVREVKIEPAHLQNDCSRYTIKFANDAAQSLSFSLQSTRQKPAVSYAGKLPGPWLACLPNAEITAVQPDTVLIDAGMAPLTGGGFEVRLQDAGWGADVYRNLIGRFTTQIFIVPKPAKPQSYFLRMYDGSTPPKFSRFATLLHVNY